MSIPSPQELAREALKALHDSPMTTREHFEFLVQQGIIDRNGRVLVAKLFGAEENGRDVAVSKPSPSAAMRDDG
jgi:predicted ArsR family transcriptional regulator